MKAKAKWIVKIPEGAEILVKEGEKVEKDQVLLELQSKYIQSFDMSLVLGRMAKTSVEEINEKFKNKLVSEGEMFLETGGLFPKKVTSPKEGYFLGVDDFYNLTYEIKTGSKKEVLSPIAAKVTKIEKERLVLEFEAIEFKGDSIIEGKVWGETDFVIRDKMSDLNFELDNNILFTSNLDRSFLTKAIVVGVTAVVTDKKDIDEEIEDINLPMMHINEEVWQNLQDKYKGFKKQVLLNSKVGRLLVVIE